jgi:hypothetical protein
MKMREFGGERCTLRNQKFVGANIKLSPGGRKSEGVLRKMALYFIKSDTVPGLHHVPACLYTLHVAIIPPAFSYFNMKCSYR